MILPDDLDAYLESLTPQKFQAAAATSGSNAVASITMPTFETTSRVELSNDLGALGMPDAFDPSTRRLLGHRRQTGPAS